MFEERLKNIIQSLNEDKLDGLLVSSVSNISYLTGYTNFSEREREAFLIITKNDQFLITDGRYKEAVIKQVPHFKLLEISYNTSLKIILKNLKDKINTLAIEEDNLTVSEFKLIKKHFKRLKHFEASLLRSVKNSKEIKKIDKACKIGDLAFDDIVKQIKIGVTEKEIARKLENFIKGKNAQLSFPPIVAFSKNSAIPHHQTGMDKLTNTGEIILLDFGVKFKNYCSDMTRTIFFGKPNNQQKKIYEVVVKAQKEAVDFINNCIKQSKDIKASAVDKVARKYIISQGFPSIPHSLGHGIGLEVHEHPHLSPKSKEILKGGMVFSIEPGIYIPDFGGVRIEDLYYLKKSGLKRLTNSSKELTVL